MGPIDLFIGISTLDIIHQVDTIPYQNEKMTSRKHLMVAGGCAANTAVAYANLNGRARLVTPLGENLVSTFILDKLRLRNVKIYDANPGSLNQTTLASILINASSGDRAVISSGSVNTHITLPSSDQIRFIL